jgi:hypothetical protein
MIRKVMIAAASVSALTSTAFAQQSQYGTADEAKAMLMKVVAAVKADKGKALDMFNKGEGGFADRDLYPFCSNTGDAITVAVGNPNAKQLLGTDGRSLKDPAGNWRHLLRRRFLQVDLSIIAISRCAEIWRAAARQDLKPLRHLIDALKRPLPHVHFGMAILPGKKT